MDNQKYELRSEQAETLIKKLPHSFILWGNTLILSLLILGFLLLDTIPLAQYSTISVILQKAALEQDHCTLELEARYPDDIERLRNRQLSLQLQEGGQFFPASTRWKIVSVQKSDLPKCLLKVRSIDKIVVNKKELSADMGEIGSAKINTGSSTILSMILKHLRF